MKNSVMVTVTVGAGQAWEFRKDIDRIGGLMGNSFINFQGRTQFILSDINDDNKTFLILKYPGITFHQVNMKIGKHE